MVSYGGSSVATQASESEDATRSLCLNVCRLPPVSTVCCLGMGVGVPDLKLKETQRRSLLHASSHSRSSCELTTCRMWFSRRVLRRCSR